MARTLKDILADCKTEMGPDIYRQFLDDLAGKNDKPIPLPEWAQWKGDGPAPEFWDAVNPRTSKVVTISRPPLPHGGE